jgi:hypothetical protein
MNAARTELQKQIREQLAKLVERQQAIANDRPLPLPEGANDSFPYWHPTIPSFALRQYRSGYGIWQLQYRTANGEKRTYTCGKAKVTTLRQAEDLAEKALDQVRGGKDPQAERRELRSRSARLTLTRLERSHPDLVKRVKAKELTPNQAATKAGIGKPNVGEFLQEYFTAMARKIHRTEGLTNFTRISPRTLKNYKAFAKHHLGPLRTIQFDELEKHRDKISKRVMEIEEELSWQSARHFKYMLSSGYKWGLKAYTGIIKVNPVPGTYVPERPPENRADDDLKHLLWPELAAIWRACEAMAAAAPTTYKGNAWGGSKPTAANSIRAGSVFLTRAEAARQTGIDKSVIWRAIKDGTLKAQSRRDRGVEDHPLKKKRGYHRRTYLISAKDLDAFAQSRAGLMRSPQYEYSVVIRLLMLLGLRYSQIGGLRWSELGELKGDKFVPSTSISVLRQKPLLKDGARRKGMKAKGGEGSTLLRYLPPLAVKLINTIERRPGRDLVFGVGPDGKQENDRYKKQLDEIITEQIRDRQKEQAERDPTVNADAEPFRKWKLHMMRHSFTTLLNDMNCPPHIVSMMINHVFAEGASATSLYNHATYIDAQKQWMNSWVTRLLNEVHGTDDTNVRRLRSIETA